MVFSLTCLNAKIVHKGDKGETGFKKNIIIFFGFFMICAAVVVIVFVLNDKNEDISETAIVKPPEIVYPTDRQISYSFTLKNTTNQVIEKSEFWTYAPVKQTATQICGKITSSHDHDLITDSFGNQILHYTFGVIPPYGSKIITITAELKLSNISNEIKPGDLERFFGPEKYIEMNHSDIIRTAEKLKIEDLLETVKKTFMWVSGNIKYAGYISQDRGALYALKYKKGDCTEYMYLFAALCRANKIPAKCIGGYVCQENSILKPSAYHNWVEIYNGKTWESADPQKKLLFKNQANYIAMRIIGKIKEGSMGNFHRFRVQGKGLKVKMNG
ncbi:MAG: hypothetical protein DRI73_10125 [Bacteroidetes bacterium]|nr:MAG: hypothetical protein DRI73_10125 [Bacteroidota bacterium]